MDLKSKVRDNINEWQQLRLGEIMGKLKRETMKIAKLIDSVAACNNSYIFKNI